MVYNAEVGDYDLEPFLTDFGLIDHFRTGKSNATMFRNMDGVVRLDEVFGTISPDSYY